MPARFDFRRLFRRNKSDADLWSGRYKIPWDDPEFSQRMLAEHLSQDHDMASRRSDVIDSQVAWIHEHICEGQPKRLLDLACGPGLYLTRLAALGHSCRGIDFSPASVAYAKDHVPADCDVMLGDLREADFGDGCDVVLMIFGEFNVFSPEEISNMLTRMHKALVTGGTLVVEAQRFESVKAIGKESNSWSQAASGVFSERPHLCLTENHWHEEAATTQQVFYIIAEGADEVDRYCNTTKAWTDDEMRQLLSTAGFAGIQVRDDWPSPMRTLCLWTARSA